MPNIRAGGYLSVDLTLLVDRLGRDRSSVLVLWVFIAQVESNSMLDLNCTLASASSEDRLLISSVLSHLNRSWLELILQCIHQLELLSEPPFTLLFIPEVQSQIVVLFKSFVLVS